MAEPTLASLNIKEWPELYGFAIHGEGPTYVVKVEPKSISDKAGIRMGDMIVELDGYNVSKEPAEVIVDIARVARRKPPPICVQSVSKRLIIRDYKKGCGFTVRGDLPVKVDEIDEKSKAHKIGMRQGDIIVDVNHRVVDREGAFKEMIENSVSDSLDIGFVSRSASTKSRLTETPRYDSRAQSPVEFRSEGSSESGEKVRTETVASQKEPIKLQLIENGDSTDKTKILQKPRDPNSYPSWSSEPVFAPDTPKTNQRTSTLPIPTSQGDEQFRPTSPFKFDISESLKSIESEPSELNDRYFVEVLPVPNIKTRLNMTPTPSPKKRNNGPEPLDNKLLLNSERLISETSWDLQQLTDNEAVANFSFVDTKLKLDDPGPSSSHLNKTVESVNKTLETNFNRDLQNYYSEPMSKDMADKITQTVSTSTALETRVPKEEKEKDSEKSQDGGLEKSFAGERSLKIVKKANEPIGIIFKKSFNRPVMIESVDDESPADLYGVIPDDVILSVNEVNVEEKGLNDIKQMLNEAKITNIVVTQKSEYDKAKKTTEEEKPVEVVKNKSCDVNVVEEEERDFKDAVNEVLSPKERSRLKKILLKYNESGNNEEYIELTSRLLNTPAKKVLWPYLEAILGEERHKPITRENVHHCSTSTATLSSDDTVLEKKASFRLVNSSNTKISYNVTNVPVYEKIDANVAVAETTQPDQQQTNNPNSLVNSKKFHSTPALYSLSDDVSVGIVEKLLKQIRYFFNEKDEEKIKSIIKAYESERKIHEFVENIKEVLDTPAKRTLWFHIVPILLDDDQEYCKRSVLRIQELDDFGAEKKRATLPRSSIFNLDGNDEKDKGTAELEPQLEGMFQNTFDRSDYVRKTTKPMLRKRKGRRDKHKNSGLVISQTSKSDSVPVFTYTTKAAFGCMLDREQQEQLPDTSSFDS